MNFYDAQLDGMTEAEIQNFRTGQKGSQNHE